MVKMDHRNEKGGYSLLRDYHSLLELRLLELANSRFVWKGKNSFSFNRCFLVIEGGGRMINHSGNQELELRQNHAYFVPPRAEISYDFQPGISLLSLHFQLYILPGVEVFGGELLCQEAAVDPERLREFAGLMARTPDWEVFCRFESLIWLLFSRFHEPDHRRIERFCGLNEKYGKILRYVHSNINAEMGVDEIADKAGVKRDTFSRHFSNDFGIPLKTFVMDELMAVSERYLLHTEMPVREIASRLKFSSEFYFSTFFKRLKGVSPTQFRAFRRKI